MKLKQIAGLTALIVLTLWTGFATAQVGPYDNFGAEPTTNHGQRWRIGYYEGGEYFNYQQVLIATIRALMAQGWIKSEIIPRQKGEQTTDLWQWLADNTESDYIEFVKNAHYSAKWDDDLRETTKNTVIKRLNDPGDIDLMLALGTWAGLDLANNQHSTPTLVLSTSDPLSAGIIKSVEDSGYKHINATVDPNRYGRQVRVFHDITGFKRLGVAFENSPNGRVYAAIDIIKSLSKEIGFTVIPCYTKSDISDISIAEKSVISCFKQLAPQVDAIYVTEQGGVTSKSLPAIVETANKYKIPTFSQVGAQEVRYGVLVSLSQANFRYFGEFHALTIAKIFNGAAPNEVPQLFEEPPKMALNLKTAEVIGFNPSLLLLGASDELFSEIETPQ